MTTVNAQSKGHGDGPHPEAHTEERQRPLRRPDAYSDAPLRPPSLAPPSPPVVSDRSENSPVTDDTLAAVELIERHFWLVVAGALPRDSPLDLVEPAGPWR